MPLVNNWFARFHEKDSLISDNYNINMYLSNISIIYLIYYYLALLSGYVIGKYLNISILHSVSYEM